MKKDTHPEYTTEIKAKCTSCGTERMFASTKKEISVEVCSSCHPFYTGVRNNSSSAGRIDKFNRKFKR